IVGRSGDKYTIYIGGHFLGHRLSFLLKDLVARTDIVPLLVPILEQFQRERTPDETFGDYCQRVRIEKLRALLPASGNKGKEEPHVAVAGSNGNGAVAAVKEANGDDRIVSVALKATAAAVEEKVDEKKGSVAPPLEAPAAKRRETFLAGP